MSPLPSKKQCIAPGFNTFYSEEDDNDKFGVDLGDDQDVDNFSSFFKKEETLGDPIRVKLAILWINPSVPLVTGRGRKCRLPTNLYNHLTPALNS